MSVPVYYLSRSYSFKYSFWPFPSFFLNSNKLLAQSLQVAAHGLDYSSPVLSHTTRGDIYWTTSLDPSDKIFLPICIQQRQVAWRRYNQQCFVFFRHLKHRHNKLLPLFYIARIRPTLSVSCGNHLMCALPQYFDVYFWTDYFSCDNSETQFIGIHRQADEISGTEVAETLQLLDSIVTICG